MCIVLIAVTSFLKLYHITVTILFNILTVAFPGILFGGVSTNSVEDRENGYLGAVGGSPLVRGSGGSCNLVQEISFHIVKFS